MRMEEQKEDNLEQSWGICPDQGIKSKDCSIDTLSLLFDTTILGQSAISRDCFQNKFEFCTIHTAIRLLFLFLDYNKAP